jgi:biopolymer transport protein ExbD
VKLKSRRELRPARIEIIPMIDTMFFLLVFFMLSSLALTRLNGLPVDLPKASTAPAQDASPPTLTIDRRGRLFFNRAALQINSLESTLKQRVRGEELLINADARVSHGLVVRCMDAARAAGISRFSIATQDATP